jgi:hypothetical protein
MEGGDLKADLHGYLQNARDALTWKLSGLSEYDVRRPLTPTGTNLLGLVKHLTGCEIGYFGHVFGRPIPKPPCWLVEDADPNVDMWATADESRDENADIVRELVDGAAGWRADARNLPSDDREWWAAHRDRVERAARDAEQASGRFA